MYYVYVLKLKSGKIYVGCTDNLERRLDEHSQRKKFELAYYEAYKSKKDASLREHRLKQRGQSIRWLKERIKNSIN